MPFKLRESFEKPIQMHSNSNKWNDKHPPQMIDSIHRSKLLVRADTIFMEFEWHCWSIIALVNFQHRQHCQVNEHTIANRFVERKVQTIQQFDCELNAINGIRIKFTVTFVKSTPVPIEIVDKFNQKSRLWKVIFNRKFSEIMEVWSERDCSIIEF